MFPDQRLQKEILRIHSFHTSCTLPCSAYFSIFSSGLAILFTQILVLVNFVSDNNCSLDNLGQKELKEQEEMGLLFVVLVFCYKTMLVKQVNIPVDSIQRGFLTFMVEIIKNSYFEGWKQYNNCEEKRNIGTSASKFTLYIRPFPMNTCSFLHCCCQGCLHYCPCCHYCCHHHHLHFFLSFNVTLVSQNLMCIASKYFLSWCLNSGIDKWSPPCCHD